MTESELNVLRLLPSMIPDLRAEFRSVIDQVAEALADLNRQGYIPEPWLGDESSAKTAAHYTSYAMEGVNSSYHSLVAYRDELARVHDTLQQMEDDYRRREGDNAALWGRLA